MVLSERIKIRNLKRWFVQCLIAVLALAGITFACHLLHLNLATISLFFVIVIVLVARAGDFIPALISSFVAFGFLWYVAPPAYSLRIDDPLDVVAVATFLITSLIIAELVSKLRKMTEDALSNVHRSLIDAEERERARIARDLHDDILQRMALLQIKVQQLKAAGAPTASGKFVTAMDDLGKQIMELSTDIQALSHALHSPKLEYLGLVKTVKGFCRETSAQGNIKINFKSDHLPTAPPPDVSLTLFRILQEALHNSTKHSQAPAVDVELFEATDGIHLIIHDAGVGFDLEAAIKGQGLGLISMRERIKLVRGDLSIQSKVNGGTTIHARAPIFRIKTAHPAA